MAESSTPGLEEVNHYFAVTYNSRFWRLSEKKDHSVEELDEMISLAHASLLHWTDSPKCKQVNLARGEYVIALAYFLAGKGVNALYHAEKCRMITDGNAAEMRDFDLAHCSLIQGMALHLNHRKEESHQLLVEARRLGELILGEKDKAIFFSDLGQAEEWMKREA